MKKYSFFLFLICFVETLTSCNNISFDSEKWKNCKINSEDGYSLRWDMSDDLIKNYGLIGKDTTYVFKLLGRETYELNANSFKVNYVLGGCRKGIDTGILELTFKNGKVVNIFRHCN